MGHTSEKSNSLDVILRSRIVAIIRLKDLRCFQPLTDALVRGGITAIEFTLTNHDALSVVRQIRSNNELVRKGQVTVGLGSVRSLDEAKLAIDCGAQFVVSPIASMPIIDHCKQNNVVVMPGAFTPTEIAACWNAGADIVKVFPARQLGPGYIRDVLAPMPYLKLMPTGGIDEHNLANYLAAGAVAVGIGGQLLDQQLLDNQDWNSIEAVARSYTQICERA
jgi:2-dehydro-3-deoxyphosphogluconate aldolase / (4S)-4-hydroxy-2-oxoglutarate aldolase